MKFKIVLACLAASCFLSTVNAATAQDLEDAEKDAAFSFADVEYFHRFTKEDQHEYTPADQEDLKTWKDMVTVLHFRNATDDEALATQANAVLENYKKAGGAVVKTTSVPRTKEKPAEHLIVVIFGRPEFFETAFARFKMLEEMGAAVVYSHRTYGENARDGMAAWVKKNGPATEKSLMEWDRFPEPSASK